MGKNRIDREPQFKAIFEECMANQTRHVFVGTKKTNYKSQNNVEKYYIVTKKKLRDPKNNFLGDYGGQRFNWLAMQHSSTQSVAPFYRKFYPITKIERSLHDIHPPWLKVYWNNYF